MDGMPLTSSHMSQHGSARHLGRVWAYAMPGRHEEAVGRRQQNCTQSTVPPSSPPLSPVTTCRSRSRSRPANGRSNGSSSFSCVVPSRQTQAGGWPKSARRRPMDVIIQMVRAEGGRWAGGDASEVLACWCKASPKAAARAWVSKTGAPPAAATLLSNLPSPLVADLLACLLTCSRHHRYCLVKYSRWESASRQQACFWQVPLATAQHRPLEIENRPPRLSGAQNSQSRVRGSP